MISKKFYINQASELTKKWIRHNVSFKSLHGFLEWAKMILDLSLARSLAHLLRELVLTILFDEDPPCLREMNVS